MCHGNAGVLENDPFCVFTAWSLLANINWVCIWVTCLAMQLWLAVVRKYQRKKLENMRPYMLAAAAFLASLILIPLGADNLGNDYGGLTMCLNKLSTQV